MKKIIRLTESDLVRIVKRVINEKEEESQNMLPDKNWLTIYNGLKTVTDSSGNMPKIITFIDDDGINPTNKKITSLNWGNHSDAGKKKNWGLSMSSDDQELGFSTKDETTSKKYENLTGQKCYKSPSYYSHELPLNYSNPETVISTVKKLVKGMG
jgi:hypothetical protein